MKIAKWGNRFDNPRQMDGYRFYVPDLLAQAGALSASAGAGVTLRLSEDQVHHAHAVLRLAEGEGVVVFDGRGAWAGGVIGTMPGGTSRGKSLAVQMRGEIHRDPPPGLALMLASAVPKGDRAQWLVEQASQLNVAALQWMDCQRGVVKPREGGAKIEKWRRVAVESARQCGRTHLMEVIEPADVEQVVGMARQRAARILWLEPREDDSSLSVGAALRDCVSGLVVALIGPEGGWSPEERVFLEPAAKRGELARVRLTDTVLRIETACAAIAAIVMSGRR